MTKFWCLLLCILCLPVTTSFAQIYRWTDDTGRVHFTNNPDTIPSHRRSSSQEVVSGTSTTSPPTNVAPPASPPSAPGAGASQSDAEADLALLQQKAQALEQQIAAAQQERQDILDELKEVRPVRMNPAFGRERRRVDDMGRALATVEQRLDALYAELQDITLQQSAAAPGAAATTSAPPLREAFLDNQGNDRTYWQRRVVTLRERLQQARQQRQSVLQQLIPELSEERSAFGRRGREVLQLVSTLEQLNQDIHQDEIALQTLRREATSAGAPASWLQ
jgi:chromosome segregation ATPase